MKFKINKLFLLISLAFAIIYGAIGEVIYKLNIVNEIRIPNIVLYITIYSVLFSSILVFYGVTKRRYVKAGKLVKLVSVLLICLILMTSLFEFIYELGKGDIKIDRYDDIQYVFLIDDSGSMSTNDENNERYAAIEKIINSMDKTNAFAVYRFADKNECVTRIGTTTSDNYRFQPQNLNIGGNTNLLSAINDIIKEIKTQKINTKIVVLTDGSPSDNHFGRLNKLIKKCIKNNVSISAVGFGAPNEVFLNDLAKSTGGVYVYSDSVERLQNSLSTIVDSVVSIISNNRDLLGYRLDSKAYNFIFILMRIVFVALLGIVWSMIKMALIGETLYADQILKVMGVIACVAAIVLELLLIMGVSDILARMIFCIMWSVTLIPQYSSLNTEYSSIGVSKMPVYH